MVIELADVRAAAARLRGMARITPVLRSGTLDASVGGQVHLKIETFQRAGAFKFRGAYNRISCLSVEELRRGVATYSSGNHGQAVALAAGLMGSHALVVMPRDAPAEKLAAVRGYGAEIVMYDRYAQDRQALGRRVAEEHGLVLVPPYDDPLVMAGQGTAALELLEEAGRLDVLVVPVGGGGLIAGSSTAAKGLSAKMRVVGVEPADGDDTRRSLATGERVAVRVPRTIADGLMAQTPGRLTFEVNRRLVDEVVTVSDVEILDAMTFLFERMKVVTEPSGAVAVAAIMSGKLATRGLSIGAIVSGGNVSAERFAGLLGARR